MAFLRWVIGVFVVVPLVLGGVGAAISGLAEADLMLLLMGAVGLGLGVPLMRFLMQWE